MRTTDHEQIAVKEDVFCNSAITKPVVCACIVIEMGSHLTKWVPVRLISQPKVSELCGFTGTIFVQYENPVGQYMRPVGPVVTYLPFHLCLHCSRTHHVFNTCVVVLFFFLHHLCKHAFHFVFSHAV